MDDGWLVLILTPNEIQNAKSRREKIEIKRYSTKTTRRNREEKSNKKKKVGKNKKTPIFKSDNNTDTEVQLG